MRNIDQLRRDVVDEARTWVDTRYHHQARLKGVGVDCVGLIIGVGLAAGVLSTWTPENWKAFEAYGRLPNPARMGVAMRSYLTIIPPEVVADGDIGWFQWREDLPMHLAIMATLDGRAMMIHANGLVGRCVEHGFAGEWPDRVHSWWRFPALADLIGAN